MSSVVQPTPSRLPTTPWGHLPPRMKVLFIRGGQRAGGWLAEAFAADSASEISLVEVEGMAAGLVQLRDDLFDAVLISQDAGNLDALEVLDAIRAGSRDQQPIVVLGEEDEHDMAALCFEAGADAYVCVRTATTRGLIWQVARAAERHSLLAENRQLQQSRQSQLQRDQGEADRLLEQQRAMLAKLPGPTDAADPQELVDRLPESLVTHYRDLLQTYVMMGAGNLTREIHQLVDQMTDARLPLHHILSLHLTVTEQMVDGLGNRSGRHVLNRADMLILELLATLAESYRLTVECDG